MSKKMREILGGDAMDNPKAFQASIHLAADIELDRRLLSLPEPFTPRTCTATIGAGATGAGTGAGVALVMEYSNA